MTRNEELALAFEAAARAANPHQQMGQQLPHGYRVTGGSAAYPISNHDLATDREAAIVSRVLAAIGRVYREAATNSNDQTTTIQDQTAPGPWRIRVDQAYARYDRGSETWSL